MESKTTSTEDRMKYGKLWEYIKGEDKDSLLLSFERIAEVSVPLDHSFLAYKKELLEYGFEVKKISMKEKTVLIERVE